VKLPQISAGEFFELLRPTAYLLSALLSIWVLASARRRGFGFYAGLAWALGTFLLPFVALPLYLIVLIFRHPPERRRSTSDTKPQPADEFPRPSIKYRFLLPAVYGMMVLGTTGVYFYRDYNSVDAHLARAAQAKLSNQSAKTISEYRLALAIEDNPHTHKLLGVELADAGQWAAALNEFRLAEKGGEPDESLPFRLGYALEQTGDVLRASQEYSRFLNSRPCQQALPDERCGVARKQQSLRSPSSLQ